MKARYLAAGIGGTLALTAGAAMFLEERRETSQVLAHESLPDAPVAPSALASESDLPDLSVSFPVLRKPEPLALAFLSIPTELPPDSFEPLPWTRTVVQGDTLDALLRQAELDPGLRDEITLAIQAEFDLRDLRPGHSLTIQRSPEGLPRTITLAIDDGVQVVITIGKTVSTRTIEPVPVIAERAGELLINGSIFVSLERSGVPARFAVDLAQILGNAVDFRRDLQGGETLKLLWQEKQLEDGTEIGEPQMTYAALQLADARFEIVWPDAEDSSATIYQDGEILRVFSPPVPGARLSSVFGQRKHPVYGNMRMHTGVDFAAPQGTPVKATGPGRVAFIGRRGGYGRVVEISHGSGTMTRYAHLSGVTEGLERGRRVDAGDQIGQVGATGTATGPNLHYEVRVEGRAVDPMSDDRMAQMAQAEAPADATARLRVARLRFAELLNLPRRPKSPAVLSTKGDRT